MQFKLWAEVGLDSFCISTTTFTRARTHTHTHTHTHAHDKTTVFKARRPLFFKAHQRRVYSLALFSPGHPEMFPSPTWLSASTESLSPLLGRRGADCLDPRRVPWLRSQHQTRSFCAVCSVLTMQSGEPEKVRSQGFWKLQGGAVLWGGREHVFKKVVVRAPHSGGMQAESLAEVSVRPHSASFREEGLPTVAIPVFSPGQSQRFFTGGNSPAPLWHPGD